MRHKEWIPTCVGMTNALRADGNLGGYRWGLGRKQALLTLEAALRD